MDLFLNPTAYPVLRFPEGVKEHEDLFKTFIQKSHGMACLILEGLSDSLKLNEEERFEIHHRPNELSTSAAVLQHYPRTDLPPGTSAGHFTHTDTGSITILFNTEWGLQVFSPQSSEWEYVPPRENCAIINVGDSLKFLSKFKLKSSLHRVVPAHDHWVSPSRYATIFFLRSSNDTRFTDTEGVEWAAGEWLARKFHNYRIPHEDQKKNAISTGQKDFVGLWEASRTTLIQ